MKNKPAVIRYGASGDDLYPLIQYGRVIKHLCLRLDARSRKRLVEVMAVEMDGNYQLNLIVAEAALSALEKLAEGAALGQQQSGLQLNTERWI